MVCRWYTSDVYVVGTDIPCGAAEYTVWHISNAELDKLIASLDLHVD
jgi:hypothetical protein